MILTGQTQFLDNKWLHPTTPQDTNSCKLNIKNERSLNVIQNNRIMTVRQQC